MKRFTNIRLPASATTTQVTPGDYNQLKEAVNQLVFHLNNAPIQPYDIDLPHAMLMSNVDQSNSGTTAENLITYGSPIIENGVRRDERNASRIRFDHTGQYLISISCQVTNRDNAIHEFELWAKNTGVNYPLSNTRFDIPARKTSSIWGHTTATANGIFTVTDTDADYLEMAWWADSTLVFVEHYDARTSPTRPAIPSVILTATFLSNKVT